MLTAKIQLSEAEKLKRFLFQKQFYHPDYHTNKVLNFIYFPLKKITPKQKAQITRHFPNVNFPQAVLKKIPQILSLDQLLKPHLTPSQLQLLPSAQEIVGSIAVLEIPPQLQSQEKLIAQALLKTNKNIQTVVKKNKEHSGTYRLRKVTHLAGKRTKETIHRENGTQLKIHLENTYFSARSANERLRIAHQVKKNETILIMFSGAAPFPLTIAKNSLAHHITAIEINPLAHQLALTNIQLNKMEQKISLLEGDVHDVLPKLKQKFDRIVIPLPKTGEQFLNLALTKSKPGTIIHLYAFLDHSELKHEAQKIKTLTHNMVKIIRHVECGHFSPSTSRYCFDLKVI